MGKHEKAIQDCNKAIQIDPNQSVLYRVRAESLLAVNRNDEAVADANRAAELVPENVVVALMRAQMLVIAGRHEDYSQACIDMLDRYRDSDDANDFCHTARMCNLASGSTNEIDVPVKLAKRAVARYPTGNHPREWMTYTLGLAYLRAGELDLAEASFHDSIAAEPTWVAIDLDWLGLTLVHQKRGETKQARKWLAKAVDKMERNPCFNQQDRLESFILRREAEQQP